MDGETTVAPIIRSLDGDRCRDFDNDCYGILDKFACWKSDPEQGVCPFLTGELRDDCHG